MKISYNGECDKINIELVTNEELVVSSLKVNITHVDEVTEDKIELEYSNKRVKVYHKYKDENTSFEIKLDRNKVDKPNVALAEKEVVKTIEALIDTLPIFQDTKDGVVTYLWSNLSKLNVSLS